MTCKKNWDITHLLLLVVSSCILVQTAHANTTASSNSADSNIEAKSTIEQQRKDKLAFIRASRKFLSSQTDDTFASKLIRYSVYMENRTMSYKKCGEVPSKTIYKAYQCYDCSASFDNLSKSDAATALCLKTPKKQ